jgi:hypothetical protein
MMAGVGKGVPGAGVVAGVLEETKAGGQAVAFGVVPLPAGCWAGTICTILGVGVEGVMPWVLAWAGA